MRIKFQQKLDELKERLLVMAGLVEQAIQRATEAYSSRDMDLCELVSLSEPAINRMEHEIDQLALDLLAMEQPMAVDLRFILAVIRINADLERVGDQAVNIANRCKDLSGLSAQELPVDIPKLAQLSTAMIRKALQSFIEADTEMAQSVLLLDDQVDELNRDAFSTLGALIQQHPERTPEALNALVISRNLERVGDHATNIAEDVIFWVSGADVRHHFAANAAAAAAADEAGR
ncbi:MAG TPA: phosphate signaling complex protein PhoU [Acidobacteriaceae bacterium]|nr:phosphate signaling complex protein PhoU [Acidobacteriaceae bacterium]